MSTITTSVVLACSIFLALGTSSSAGQEEAIPTHLDNEPDTSASPPVAALKDPDYLVREAAMNTWNDWVDKNPSTSLDILKRIYAKHRSHPEVRARLSFLIKKVMMLEVRKVSLGISFKELDYTMNNGVTIRAMKVTRVTNGGACHRAGIKRDDIIIGFGDKVASKKEDVVPVKKLIPRIKANTPTKIHAMRGKIKLTFKATFTENTEAKKSDINERRRAFEKLIEELDNQ